MELYFYYASKEYIEYLKNAERAVHSSTRVPDVDYANKQKFLYGAVLTVDGLSYYVPVSSYSKKQQDLMLITDKTGDVKGSLRFSYMIPIPKECLRKMDINQFESEDYRIKVSKELAFVRRARDKIAKRAKSTYDAVTAKKEYDPNFCDFKLLEAAYISYCREHGYDIPKEYLQLHPELLTDLKQRTQQKHTSDHTDRADQNQTHREHSQATEQKPHTLSRAKRSEITAQSQRAGHTAAPQQRGDQIHSHDDTLS